MYLTMHAWTVGDTDRLFQTEGRETAKLRDLNVIMNLAVASPCCTLSSTSRPTCDASSKGNVSASWGHNGKHV